ncbi:phage antirepressor [Rothia sp. P100]|uniref:phage antirepressor n=1 Tax=Rothia sp. P100 TaxID=2939578 RepID=UPI00203BD87F|nr:phage antirepressor [Rothia sp. P100]MCM3510449.1 phage antirepressor [Rothia sp. P100]
MNQEIQPFNFNGLQLRALLINGEPWFVAADVANLLGYDLATNMSRNLDPEEKGIHNMNTLGGEQKVSIINESGLYSAIMRSRKPEAKAFKKWVTNDVLPTIRKTGEYKTPQTLEQRSLALMGELTAVVQQQRAELEVVRPKAEQFDDFLSAEGSYAVGEAAKVLQRAGIEVGPLRLFKKLDDLKWTYLRGGERHIMQAAIERGYLTAKAQSYFDQNAGVRKMAAPQVRVTTKGLTRLREILLPSIEELTQIAS